MASDQDLVEFLAGALKLVAWATQQQKSTASIQQNTSIEELRIFSANERDDRKARTAAFEERLSDIMKAVAEAQKIIDGNK